MAIDDNVAYPLPAHLHKRGMHGGPVGGAYLTFNISKEAIAAGQTDLEVGAIALPCDCRVMEVAVSTTSSAGGASRATFQLTDGTNDLISADPLVVTASSQVITPTSTQSLVAAQRTRSKGDRLQLDVTTVASEVVADLNVAITVYVRNHVVALEAND